MTVFYYDCITASFEREMAAAILSSIREGNWMASSDLKDYYFQFSSRILSRKFLRFFFRGYYELVSHPMV